jgi:hypothetical protein
MDMVNMGPKEDETPNMNILMKYVPKPRVFPPPSANSADLLRFSDARSLTWDYKQILQKV